MNQPALANKCNIFRRRSPSGRVLSSKYKIISQAYYLQAQSRLHRFLKSDDINNAQFIFNCEKTKDNVIEFIGSFYYQINRN